MSKSPSVFYTMHDSTCSKLTVQSSTYKDGEKSHHPPEILVNDAVLIFFVFWVIGLCLTCKFFIR